MYTSRTQNPRLSARVIAASRRQADERTDDPSADTHTSRDASLLKRTLNASQFTVVVVVVDFVDAKLSSYRVDSLFLSLPCLALPSCHYYRRSFIFFLSRGFFPRAFFSHARFSIKTEARARPEFGDGEARVETRRRVRYSREIAKRTVSIREEGHRQFVAQ